MRKSIKGKMMETVATAAKAAQGLFQKTHPLKAKWQRIDTTPLPRSSHSLSIIAGRAYIFGGEINSQEPVDNDMHIITLPYSSTLSADYRAIHAKPEHAGGVVPEARAGHTATVIGERIFIFGGRGRNGTKPLEENGRIWVYETRLDAWSFIDPVRGSPVPTGRSDHSSVSIDRPKPPNMKSVQIDNATEMPRAGAIAESAQTDEEKGGYGTIFVHAGSLASSRTNDVWGFDIRSKTWKEFPTAPGKPRSGTSLTVSKQRIFRYGGFNGVGEEGGKLDILELALETFNDRSSLEEIGVTTKGGWSTLDFTAENMGYPGDRSVAGFQTINTGMGRDYLVLFLGEKNPSSQGQETAGQFWGDVWAFQAPPQGMTGASLKDATWQAIGRETGEGLWSEVKVSDAEGEEGEDVRSLVPSERGSFASAAMGDLGVSSVFLWGGINEKNKREDNGWILTFE